jgi:Predicted solute binding protein
MKKAIPLILFLVFMSGCVPSEVQLQTALARTLTAMPTETPVPTNTATPTLTPTPTQTPTPIPTPTPTSEITSIEAVIKLFTDANLPLTEITYLTEETDANELIGRPNQYIAKVIWRDERIKGQTNPGVQAGGSIEMFLNSANMETRKAYLDTVTQAFSIFVEYSYGNGIFLLRLSHSLTPTQAQEYESLFMSFP